MFLVPMVSFSNIYMLTPNPPPPPPDDDDAFAGTDDTSCWITRSDEQNRTKRHLEGEGEG